MIRPLSTLFTVAYLAGCTSEADPGTPPVTPPDEALEITVRSAATTISQATVSATFSAPGPAAAACVRRDDPEEVHLLESPVGIEHAFRFVGLLSDTNYDCVVAETSGAGDPVETTFTTPEAPGALASATVERDPSSPFEMTGAYTVMTVRPECSGGPNYLAVLDPEGHNRWRYELPNALNIGVEVTLDGPDRFLYGGGKDAAGVAKIIDVRDGEVWALAFPGSDERVFHHDARRIADGRILTLEQDEDDGWQNFGLRLSDDAGDTSWEWTADRGVAEGWLPPATPENLDPHHANWADVHQTHTEAMAVVSLCYAFMTVAIDVADGELLWRFGPGGDFTLEDVYGEPLGEDAFPECQHGLQVDGTHLLVYDNGLNRGSTRAVEYALDPVAGIATMTWEWKDEGFFEPYHGGVDWLDEEHQRLLVAEGNNDCAADSRHSQVVEVDRATGDPVHRLVLNDVGDWIYRAHRIDGCDLFANTRYCSALAQRLEALAPVLGR